MTVTYFNWQSGLQPGAPYTKLSPNLIAVRDEIGKRFGGSSLGGYGQRPIRGGQAWSSHSFGAAIDWRIEDQNARIAAMQFLVDHYEILGIQAIHDYFGCRIWRANRYPGKPASSWWRTQTKSTTTGMGQSWAVYLHIETDQSNWGNSTPVPNRFQATEPKPEVSFVPECGIWGLWPLSTAKPTLRETEGVSVPQEIHDATRYLQGVLVRKASQNIKIDGDFGPATTKAVVNLQSYFNAIDPTIKVDGIVGKQTWALIDKLSR